LSDLSPTLIEMINVQISREAYNSQLYHKLGSYFKNIGLDNIGDWFYENQRNEEHEHQNLLSKYLIDRNKKVEMLKIPAVDLDFEQMSFIEIAEIYLQTEKDTTDNLSKIAAEALKESDFMTFQFMQEMINRQRQEEEEAYTMLDKFTLADNDTKTMVLLDSTFSD
jgi:ferritin